MKNDARDTLRFFDDLAPNNEARMMTICMNSVGLQLDTIWWAFDSLQLSGPWENRIAVLHFLHDRMVPQLKELALDCGDPLADDFHCCVSVLQDIVWPSIDEAKFSMENKESLDSVVIGLRESHRRAYDMMYKDLVFSIARMWLVCSRAGLVTGRVSSSESTRPRVILNDLERALITALGKSQRLTGASLAEKTIYNFDSTTKSILAQLVRRGILDNSSQGSRHERGYKLTDAYTYLLDES